MWPASCWEECSELIYRQYEHCLKMDKILTSESSEQDKLFTGAKPCVSCPLVSHTQNSNKR